MASRSQITEHGAVGQLSGTVERVSDAVMALDKDLRFTYVNEKAANLAGRRPEALLGRSVKAEYPEDDAFRRQIEKAAAEQAPIHAEFYFAPWNRWFERRIYPSPDGVSVFAFEITARKHAESAERESAGLLKDQTRVLELIGGGAALSETLDQLARVVEAHSPDMLCSILVLDADGRHLRHGAAPSLPEDYIRAIDGLTVGPCEGSCGTAAFRREPVVVEDVANDRLWARYRDVALKHGLRACWSNPIFDAEQNVLGTFACYFRTPTRPAERHWKIIEFATHTAAIAICKHHGTEALRASERRLRLAVSGGKIGTWESDLAGRLVVSDEFKALFGWPAEANPTLELVLRTIHPEDRRRVEATLQRLRTSPAEFSIEYRIIWPDGSVHWIEGKGRAEFDDASQPVHAMGVVHDITDRKRAQEEIERREAQFAEAQRIAHVGSYEWDVRKNVVYRSEEQCRIFGLPCGEFEATFESFLRRVHPDDRSSAREVIERAYRERKSFDFEYRIVRPDGAVRLLHSQGRWTFDEQHEPVRLVGIIQDITERRQAEDQLRQSEERFQLAARATNDLIWDWDLATDAVWWNERATTLFKYPPEQVPPNLSWWTEHLHPDDLERVVTKIRAAAARGEHFWSDEYRFQRADGSYADVLDRGYVVFDSAGKPIRMIGAMADITERRRAMENLERAVAERTAELQSANRELQNEICQRKRAEELLRARNEELKGFAYTVSHDLKAPLRGIAGYAQELERRHSAGLGERALFCISQIRTAVKNLDRLIEDLLHYARLDTETPTYTEVNIPALVDGILSARKPLILEQGAEIALELPPSSVRTWERGLLQILTNLIDNALTYSRNARPPRIRIAGQADAENFSITVSDNGIGFDMKYHDRIFGLFNRLVRQDEFEGTGAGLAIVKKLADKLGGRIRAESKRGAGATFFLDLPNGPPPSARDKR